MAFIYPRLFYASINYSLYSKTQRNMDCVFPIEVCRNYFAEGAMRLLQSGLLSADGVLYFHLQNMGHSFCPHVQLLLLSMGNVGADQG